MANYAYHFFDLATRTYLDTLPVENVSFGWELQGIGQWSGDLLLSADGVDPLRVQQVVRPWRTKVFTERDQALVWGGWINEAPGYDSSSRRLSISAEETLGSFAARRVGTLEQLGVDQLAIARLLLQRAQSDENGDMGLVLGGGLSGVLRDAVYSAPEQTWVLDALTELSEAVNGFEFLTSVSWDENRQPREEVVFGYPRLGRVARATGMVLEYNAFSSQQGNVISYQRPEGTGFATVAHATTQTEEGVPLESTATALNLLAAGYPRIETSVDYEGVTHIDTLKAHADGLLAAAAGPRSAWTFSVKAIEGAELGDWQVGDDVLVRITDHAYPPGYQGRPGYIGYQRIIAGEVTPGPEGIEAYTFTMAEQLNTL